MSRRAEVLRRWISLMHSSRRQVTGFADGDAKKRAPQIAQMYPSRASRRSAATFRRYARWHSREQVERWLSSHRGIVISLPQIAQGLVIRVSGRLAHRSYITWLLRSRLHSAPPQVVRDTIGGAEYSLPQITQCLIISAGALPASSSSIAARLDTRHRCARGAWTPIARLHAPRFCRRHGSH